MRITVSLVVNLIANGMSIDEIVDEYPDLEPDDVRQALSYASALANEEVHPFRRPAHRERGHPLKAQRAGPVTAKM
jgi:Protein of unknown function (DUF433)